ncbi:PIN domain-containing protein [uncultured Thiodictyon sp.]|uniref:type II toxin-antitoxin system VapC family toxin n=1 Tax=uncultured Thiodictyon sp. TaxID=1846217 RepID=UPI0025DA00B8|nr:PIN domain-containing protein [uncultured Thiodictyon sp.]
MTRWAIVDTGPLVAFLDRRERHHAWAVAQMRTLKAPLLVCESVLTEAMFLLSGFPAAREKLMHWLDRGVLEIGFNLADHKQTVTALLLKYQDVPMALADACLVRMTEIHDRHVVFTLDSDFSIYRKHGRLPIAVLVPDRP